MKRKNKERPLTWGEIVREMSEKSAKNPIWLCGNKRNFILEAFNVTQSR